MHEVCDKLGDKRRGEIEGGYGDSPRTRKTGGFTRGNMDAFVHKTKGAIN